ERGVARADRDCRGGDAVELGLAFALPQPEVHHGTAPIMKSHSHSITRKYPCVKDFLPPHFYWWVPPARTLRISPSRPARHTPSRPSSAIFGSKSSVSAMAPRCALPPASAAGGSKPGTSVSARTW